MSGVPSVDAVLCAWAAAAVLFALGPPTAAAFGLAGTRTRVRHDPDAALPADADGAGRYAELVALGFRPAGAVVDTCYFMAALHWRKRFVTHTLEFPDGKCFASLYRLLPGDPTRVMLRTVTAGDGLVTTGMPGVGAGVVADDADGLWTEHPPGPVAGLLAAHRGRVDEFARTRGRPAVAETFAGLTSELGDDPAGPTSAGAYATTWVLFLAPFALALPAAWAALPLDWPGRLAAALGAAGTAHALLVRFALPRVLAFANPGLPADRTA